MSDNIYNDMMPLYHKRLGLVEKTVQYLDKVSLQTVRSCLSIGPGTGLLDLPVLRSCPHLKGYTAIESNAEACNSLKSDMAKTCPQVTTRVHTALWNDWFEQENSTHDKYDLILVLHVIYCIPDKHTLLQQCQQLLTPNGRAVIGFCLFREDNTMSSIMRQFSPAKPYTKEDFKNDLQLGNINNANLDIMSLDFDLSDRDDVCLDMLMFFSSIEIPNVNKRPEVDAFVAELHPDQKGIHHVMMASYGPKNQ